MALLVELAGRTFALELEGPGTPQPVDGGLLLPPGRAAVLHTLGDALFYRHGQNSWSPCGWRRLSEPPLRIADPQPARHRRRSRLGRPAPPPLLGRRRAARAPTATCCCSAPSVSARPRLSADHDTFAGWYETGGAPWFLAYGPEADVFAAYTRHLATHLGARDRRAGNVWCSWYAYYEGITETQLAKDFDGPARPALRRRPDRRRLGDRRSATGSRTPSSRPAWPRSPSGSPMPAWSPGCGWRRSSRCPTPTSPEQRPELLLRDAGGQPVVAGYNWGDRLLRAGPRPARRPRRTSPR